MKKILILSIGTIKEKPYRELISKYITRLRVESRIELVELPALSFSDKNKLEVKKKESEKILIFLEKRLNSKTFLLSENGVEMDSIKFSKKIFSVNEEIIFVIAGSLGFDFSVLSSYDKISLSKMTFLHEMTKVILIEQIYRAFKIEKGSNYHY